MILGLCGSFYSCWLFLREVFLDGDGNGLATNGTKTDEVWQKLESVLEAFRATGNHDRALVPLFRNDHDINMIEALGIAAGFHASTMPQDLYKVNSIIGRPAVVFGTAHATIGAVFLGEELAILLPAHEVSAAVWNGAADSGCGTMLKWTPMARRRQPFSKSKVSLIVVFAVEVEIRYTSTTGSSNFESRFSENVFIIEIFSSEYLRRIRQLLVGGLLHQLPDSLMVKFVTEWNMPLAFTQLLRLALLI